MPTVRINFNMDEKQEKRLRGYLYETEGLKKGSMTNAIIKAIDEWLEKKGVPSI